MSTRQVLEYKECFHAEQKHLDDNVVLQPILTTTNHATIGDGGGTTDYRELSLPIHLYVPKLHYKLSSYAYLVTVVIERGQVHILYL